MVNKILAISIVGLLCICVSSVKASDNEIIQRTNFMDNPVKVLQLSNQKKDIDWTELNLSEYVSNNTVHVYLSLQLMTDRDSFSKLIIRKNNNVTLNNLVVTSFTKKQYYYTHVWVKLDENKTIQYTLIVGGKKTKCNAEINLMAYVDEHAIDLRTYDYPVSDAIVQVRENMLILLCCLGYVILAFIKKMQGGKIKRYFKK